ncbi:YheC/YheD family endospore coat-associated protein [Calidifontibacillus oryziterrae]|uniref:YheC/YheD family endospore coat-associated protein n=1 Tax=Calidifontibacillus oryziterrae TaxID=1191699 RepID=UPI0003161795|nr:YheC/YheD family protein [Calidifontibacillus oryziterrae]
MNNFYKVQLLPCEVERNDKSPIIIISRNLMEQTNTTELQKVALRSGKCLIDCNIDVHSASQEAQTIYCSKVLYEKLFLPESPINIYLKVNSEDAIWEFGPYIGIVTDQIKNNHFGTIDKFIYELQRYAREKSSFLYVFHYQNYHNDYVDGYWYNGASSGWYPHKLPVPHVIHNRIHSRITERSSATSLFFKQLEKVNIPYFNERFLNKWEVFELLCEYDYLLPYLPHTKLLNGRATIEEMLKDYETVFIKPVHGSQGKNIFKINQLEAGFNLDYTTFSGEIERYYPTIMQLYDVIRPKFKEQRYIIQQGLKLLSWQDRPLDFRLLCHQKYENEWVISSQVARVSSKNEFVSNISRGGELFTINHVLFEHFEQKTAIHLKKLLAEIAIEVAFAIHQHTDGIYGELGIDLALDEDGKPWIIEVNTKPSKNHDLGLKTLQVRPSAKAIINFCHNLTAWNF